jgi:hypothetical protein
MARCEFMGFDNVSGTLSKTTYLENGKRVTVRTIAKVVNGKQRIYFREDKQRSTPLSDAEIKARQRFDEAANYWKNLSDEQKARWQKEFKRNKFRFNGKNYSQLRGYVIARFIKGDSI